MNTLTRTTAAIRQAAPYLTVEAANRIAQAVLSVLHAEQEPPREPHPTRRADESEVDWALRAAVIMGPRDGEDEAAYGRRLDGLRSAQQDARKAEGDAAEEPLVKATAVWAAP